MTTATLIQWAQKAHKPTTRINSDEWLPVVHILRNKNWSWQQIYDGLKEQGVEVHENPRSFGAVMARKYAKWIAKQAGEAAIRNSRRARR